MSTPTQRPPLILISPSTERRGAEFEDRSTSLSHRYSAAVAAEGAIPLILPVLADRRQISEAVRRSDGVMLSGGDDLQPGLYRKSLPAALRRTLSPTDPARDFFELLLIEEVFQQRKPLLAICRGHQLLNVALGGTLHVDLPSQAPSHIRHSRSDRKDQVVHNLELHAGSLIAQVTGVTTLGVNSTHHQAVNELAPGLNATGLSPDGLVEVLELGPDLEGSLPWLLSVQFHPERLLDRHPSHRAILRAFVEAARPKSRTPAAKGTRRRT